MYAVLGCHYAIFLKHAYSWLTRLMECLIIHWIYFMRPSGKEPIENVWEGEVLTFCQPLLLWTGHIFHCLSGRVETAQGFVSVRRTT